MTLLDEIRAKCPQELIDAQEHGQIAALVSVGRTRIVTRLGGVGAIIETLGPVDGPALLDALELLREQDPAIKWGWRLIDRGELDFGSTVTRNMIDSLVLAGVMTANSAAALKALAVVPDPVPVDAVVHAMEGL